MNDAKTIWEHAQEHLSAYLQKAGKFSWLVTGFIVGFAASSLLLLFLVVLPDHRMAAEQKSNLQKWSELLRMEQQRVADMKQISQSEIKTWVGAVSDQNVRFNLIEQRLHEQELELADPGMAIIIVVALVAFVCTGFLAFMYRDVNKEASTTLMNLAALPPESMMSVVRGWTVDGAKAKTALPRETPPRQRIEGN